MERSRLTQGEEEGIKANLLILWDLSDEPLRDATDGHWGKSHMTHCGQYIREFTEGDRVNSAGVNLRGHIVMHRLYVNDVWLFVNLMCTKSN